MTKSGPVARGAADRGSYRHALASGEFRALLVSRLVSQSGTSVAAVALTVLVYRRTNSPLLASLAFALSFLPYLFSGAVLSAVVDRVRPRRLVTSCDAASAVLAGTMALPHAPVPILLALLFGIGTLSALASGAAADLVRVTVAADAYVPARSLWRLAAQFAQIGGNATGGLLIVVLSPGTMMLLNAASFVFSSATVRLIVRDHANSGVVSQGTLLRDSLHGARQVFACRPLVALLLIGWLGPMLQTIPEAVGAPYVADHHNTSGWVGWWLVTAPLGVIVGDVLGVRLLTAHQQRKLIAPMAVASFVPLLGFALDPPVPAAMALLFGSSVGAAYMLGLDGRIRDTSPEHLFARTMTLSIAGLATLEGIGFALGGALAQALNPAAAILIAGISGIAVTVVLLGRELRPRRRSEALLIDKEGSDEADVTTQTRRREATRDEPDLTRE